MKTLFIRGSFLNRYEGQNIEALSKTIDITGIAGKTAFHNEFTFPVVKFWSPYDVINILPQLSGRLVKALCNRMLGDSHFLFGFEQWVKKTGPYDIAHVADTHYGYCLQAVRLKKMGLIKKIVATCWETIPFNNETVARKRALKYEVRRGVDFFVCPTQKAKQALVDEGVSPQKISVIRVGVDLQRFKSKKRRPDQQGITILFVGRLVEEKGIRDVLYAFKRINDHYAVGSDHKKVIFRIVGAGSMEPYVDSFVNDHGLNTCSLEHKKYEDMPDVYRGADILLVPSRGTNTWEEQYGMVIVEAMASGLPIVAFDSGAIAEVVGSAGIVVPEGDREAMLRGLVNLIDDEIMRYKYSLMARKRAEDEFDADQSARQIEAIYSG